MPSAALAPERRHRSAGGVARTALRGIGQLLITLGVVVLLFVVYEVYRASQTGSVLLPVLAVVDVAVITLVVREYRALRRAQSAPRGSVKGSPHP